MIQNLRASRAPEGNRWARRLVGFLRKKTTWRLLGIHGNTPEWIVKWRVAETQKRGTGGKKIMKLEKNEKKLFSAGTGLSAWWGGGRNQKRGPCGEWR